MSNRANWDDDLSPEFQAEFEAYRAKLDASTTTLDVPLPEFLKKLETLTDSELAEISYDRAFRQWKNQVELSNDRFFLFAVIAFVLTKPDPKLVELQTRILASVANNTKTSPELVQHLLDLSEEHEFDLEDKIAMHPHLTEDQALRLAESDDEHVQFSLAHNKEVPYVGLKALAASYDGSDPDLLREILNNPACSPEIRKLLPAAEVAEADAENASALIEIQQAGYGDDFWESFEVSAYSLHELIAALNPGCSYEVAADIAARNTEAGVIARKMMDEERYLWMAELDEDDEDAD